MSNLLGKIASLGVGEIARSAGDLLGSIRRAITGELPAEERARLEADLVKLQALLAQLEVRVKELQSSIIIAEAQGKSWLQRNWRPLLMAEFGIIIANNYILVPVLNELFGWTVTMEIPPDMWALLKLGIGGYIVGRSGEKITESGGLRKLLGRD